jgi:hypothetical protein
MVTNSFQEWGLPIWEIFCLLAHSGTGSPPPVWLWGWCFCLPLSHGCAGASPKILAKKPKFPALPFQETEFRFHFRSAIVAITVW